eukprot:GCRY01000257.1.p1 GENE.GCRY01000257.1~~GCRY01000257.1.p1  ORF type:complete len:463 (+),score=106.48 GCRY01000257.1:152-1540(+)
MSHKEVNVKTPVLPHGLVEKVIGKPANLWTHHDLAFLIRDQEIKIVSLVHVCTDGWLKCLDFVPRSDEHVYDILMGGERADGSSLFKNTGMGKKSDMVLRPRLETAFFDPFSEVKTLCILCSHLTREGEPLPQSPDSIIAAAEKRAKDVLGCELWALGEVEYFLGKRASRDEVYGAAERGYHSSAPFMFGQDIRRKAIEILKDIGVPIKYAHGEVGYIPPGDDGKVWEQHEIELQLAPLRRAADAVVLTMWVLRNLAARNGMVCSLDPVVKVGHAGSGMHFHLSAVRNGEHIAHLKPGQTEFTDECKWLIAGLVKAGGALMAFGNREEGSFLRLTGGKEAPTSVTWGWYDRHALVRLPTQPCTQDGRVVVPATVEYRLGDGSAHPHLLLAGIAQAACYGKSLKDLDAFIEQTGQKDGEGSATVPHKMEDVASTLKEMREVFIAGDVFKPEYIDALVSNIGKH